MASWREEYIKALEDRDKREREKYARISDDFIDAYTKLLDRTAVLETEKAASAAPSVAPSIKEALNLNTLPSPSPSTTSLAPDLQLKLSLAEALRANGTLTTRLKNHEAELVYLRDKTKTDTKRLEDLTRERLYLIQKVKDRDEELKGKETFVRETQDEMIGLNLQLNMSEERNRKLREENEELIERWMKRKEMEAEEMNRHWVQ